MHNGRLAPLDEVAAHQTYDAALGIRSTDSVQLFFVPQVEGVVFADNAGNGHKFHLFRKIFPDRT